MAIVTHPEEEIRLRITVSVATCDQCEARVAWGEPQCSSCGGLIEVTKPEDAPLNRVKIASLGEFLTELEAVSDVDRQSGGARVTITDEQLVSYLNRNEVFAKLQMRHIHVLADEIDLSSEESIRSVQTRQAFEALLNHARGIRQIYDELIRVGIASGAVALHATTLAVAEAVLETHLWVVRAFLALTVEEASLAQERMQSGLDRAFTAAEAFSDGLDQVNAASLDTLIDERLRSFSGGERHYVHQGQADFAAVLAEALHQRDGDSLLVRRSGDYLGDVLSIDLAELPRERLVGLYLLAATVAVSDDPLSLVRRMGELFEILNDAYSVDPEAVGAMTVAAESDTEDALVHLLSVGDQLRALQFDALTREAARLTLLQSYGTLVEWIYGRLSNPVLTARSILRRHPRAYPDFREMQFAEKHNELKQESDPRYKAALAGVAAVARHAGAHGGVDLAGTKIRLWSTDRMGRRKEEELSDEDFENRLSDLLLTCLALLVSFEALRAEHWDSLPEPALPTKSRVTIEVARAVVGYFGLSGIEISEDGGRVTAVRAQLPDEPLGDPARFLAAAATLAVLFSDRPRLRLRLSRGDEQECQLTVPTSDAVEFLALPEEARLLAALKLHYLSTIEPETLALPEKYVQQWIKGSARLVAQELQKLQRLRSRLPGTERDYVVALEDVINTTRRLRDLLQSVGAPSQGVAIRDRLFDALGLLEEGLGQHLDFARADNLRRVHDKSDLLERAVETIVVVMR